MKYDAVSFVPDRLYHSGTGKTEFDNEKYCLELDGAITLHLKKVYLDSLLGDTPSEQRQIRKWFFYTTHLNCLYLLLDSFVLEELRVAYFSIEEVTTQNVNVVSAPGSTGSINPLRRTDVPISPSNRLQVPKRILELINASFGATTSDFEQVYILSEAAKSLALYKQADFTTSFVLSWFLLERFIEARWKRYLEAENKELDHGQKRINADRKQTLNDSRSYPVSVKLQFLELAGELSLSQFLDLDFLRGKRNEIVHPSKKHKKDIAVRGDPESFNKAFELLKQFIASDFHLQVNFSISYSWMGIYDR